MSSISIFDSNKKCKLHKSDIKAICRSPFCFHYRELCEKCIKQDRDHQQKNHIDIDKALGFVQLKVKQIEKSLTVLRKQKHQKSKDNKISIPQETQDKITAFREIIIEKLDQFEATIKQKYQSEVNLRLETLQEAIKKSVQLLNKEATLLEKQKYSKFELRKFFINFDYWEHERKYYKSYVDEILEKQINNFKKGLNEDNIMRLIVNFDLHLSEIINSEGNKGEDEEVAPLPHLFFQEAKDDRTSVKKYEVMQLNSRLETHFSDFPNLLNKQKCEWEGPPISIYFPEKSCYYIFGQGLKPSNVILKFEDETSGKGRFTHVADMLTKRSGFGVCHLNGQIYVIGGYNEKDGCMVKCQKIVISQKLKNYHVSSLEQRSFGHSVSTFKERYILKFGGSKINIYEKSKYFIGENFLNLNLFPEVYDSQKQSWKTVNFNTQKYPDRLDFGIQPGITVSRENNRVFVFGLQSINQETQWNSSFSLKKFEIQLYFGNNDKQMKVEFKKASLPKKLAKKYHIYSSTFVQVNRQDDMTVAFVARDQTKRENVIGIYEITM